MGDDIGSGSVFLIFAVVQLCTAEYGRLLRVENDLKRQSVNLNFVRGPDGVGF